MDIETIKESYINGNFEQMREQIRAYGVTKCFIEMAQTSVYYDMVTFDDMFLKYYKV